MERGEDAQPRVHRLDRCIGARRQQCARLGAHEYLSKPVEHGDLLRALRRALDDPKTTTEEYEVVTLRLPTRVVKCLAGIDENLERAVTRVCEERFKI